MQKLVNRVEHLEAGPQRYRPQRLPRDSQQPSRQKTRAQPVVYYRCGQVGHFARGCAMRDTPKQSNEQDQLAVGSGISGQNVPNMSINSVSSYTLSTPLRTTSWSYCWRKRRYSKLWVLAKSGLGRWSSSLSDQRSCHLAGELAYPVMSIHIQLQQM